MIIKNLQALDSIQIPDMAECHWDYPCPAISNLENTLKTTLHRASLANRIKSGQRIAITAGSRGISQIATILAILCHELKKLHAEPFIVPAMGSHGGGTLEGQIALLNSYGITSQRLGVPIKGSEKAIEIGRTAEGMPVYMDEAAFTSDGIIVVNRIKSHTSFQSTTESGICKMLVVGLGKDQGARQIHNLGVKGLKEGIPQAARVILRNAPVLFGIGIIENAAGGIAAIEALAPHEIETGEARLLHRAKELTPIIPFKQLDLLIVTEMGKDISGTGLDTNVIGRRMIAGEDEPDFPKVSRIVVLDLSENSQGNATGLGLADIITQRLYDKIDFEKTLRNIITSTFIERAKIPIVMPTDRSAIQLGLKTCWVLPISGALVVWIKNTYNLKSFFISPGLLSEVQQVAHLSCASKFSLFPFDEEGSLKNVPGRF
ncbi:MAG: lactate racemase domain-containing protein [Proteobacteria bacterium]|nr:lactate racemase domain-containing protein [Pseudomonadota bacterium]